jgi:hypothetical protein
VPRLALSLAILALAAAPAGAASRTGLHRVRVTVAEPRPTVIYEILHARICGPAGPLRVQARESIRRPDGRVNSQAHRFRRSHPGGCRNYAFRYRYPSWLAGIGVVTLKTRAKAGAAAWSRTVTLRGGVAD